MNVTTRMFYPILQDQNFDNDWVNGTARIVRSRIDSETTSIVILPAASPPHLQTRVFRSFKGRLDHQFYFHHSLSSLIKRKVLGIVDCLPRSLLIAIIARCYRRNQVWIYPWLQQNVGGDWNESDCSELMKGCALGRVTGILSMVLSDD